MKINSNYIIVFLLSVLFSCSSKTEKGEAIKPSKEMKGFMNELNGSYEGINQALVKYGEKEIIDDDITRLDLKNPKLILLEKPSSNQECYTMEANIGVTIKTFVICWEKNKIYSIEDQGFKE